MRAPSKNDFQFDVEGFGTCTAARRTINDELKIQVEFARITEGQGPNNIWLYNLGTWMATLRVQLVSAPGEWNPDNVDPFDGDALELLQKVHDALLEKERSFRKKTGAGREAPGASDGQDGGVLVPAQVQPAAE